MTLNLRESLNFILKPALLLAGCLCMACSSGDKHVDDPDGPDNPGGGSSSGDHSGSSQEPGQGGSSSSEIPSQDVPRP